MSRWEHIDGSDFEGGYENTERLAVPGGWLYRATRSSADGEAVALCFVPDTAIEEPEEEDAPIPVESIQVLP